MSTTDADRSDIEETIAVGRPPGGVSAAVKTMMRAGAVPGVSLAVVSRDRVLLAGGWGLADRSANRSASASTAYLWFSMTKIVTATAALRLAEEGRLDLDAPVGEYVDYLQAPGPCNPPCGSCSPIPPASAIRCRSAGRTLPRRKDPNPRLCSAGSWGVAAPTALRWGSRRGTQTSPTWRSDRSSPRRLACRSRPTSSSPCCGPSAWTAPASPTPQPPHRATGYVKAPRIADPALRRLLPQGVAGSRHGPYLALNPFYVDGPAYGGLVGDVLDAGTFLRMHLGDGEIDGRRVLDPRTARSMRSIVHPGKPFNHGTGWFRRPTKSPGNWVEHYGSGAGFWNVMRLYPDRGLGVVIMSNSTTSYDFEPVLALLAGASWS